MKKITVIKLLSVLIIVVLLSSCSLFPSEIERHLFFDSICWEDDSHILMYTMVRKWVNTTAMSITGSSGYWAWSQGEIWRINVFTGEKELLLRREGDYYTGLSSPIKIDILGDKKLISLDANAYLMEGESADWQEIPGIYEAEWVNENEIIGISEEAQALVKYDLESETITNEYYTVVSEVYRRYKHISYDRASNDCMLTMGSSTLVLFDNMTFQEELVERQDTFIDADSNSFVCDSYNEPFCHGDNSKSVAMRIFDSYEIQSYYYLMEIDTNKMVKTLIEFDDFRITPDRNIQYFIIPSYVSGSTSEENGLILYNRDKEIINTTKFLTDQLD
ncbi:MAG: hypothetical protein SVK54_07435 [candidate division WOR-3 bacterium]|nr:hypothetical protein [candidate division WOR-3 bacterium]